MSPLETETHSAEAQRAPITGIRPSRSRILVAGLALGALWAPFLGCGPRDEGEAKAAATVAPPSRVFLITIDTLRADHLGSYGYERPTSPFLDELAARGTLFEHAIVQWPKTGPSFASMFTGLYPRSTGLRRKAALTLPDRYETMAEVFRAEGYTTVAVVGNAVLDGELGWRQGFDEYVEAWSRPGLDLETRVDWKRALDATQITPMSIEVAERYREDERLFAWFHFMDPHGPYVLPPGESNPFLDEVPEPVDLVDWPIPKDIRLEDRKDLAYYVAQYDANVAVADRWIRTLFDRLEELGLLDDALVVVTSDHGESLGERRTFGHGKHAFNNTLRVPLIFFDPERVAAGRRVEQPVELVSLLSTLKELVQVEAGTDVVLDGASFADALRGEDARVPGPEYAFAEAGHIRRTYLSVQNAERKLIALATPDKDLERYQLYHLEDDPAEQSELLSQGAELPGDLAARLTEYFEIIPGEAARDDEQAELAPEIERALKALGYVN